MARVVPLFDREDPPKTTVFGPDASKLSDRVVQ